MIAGADAAFLDDYVIGVVCLYKYPEMVFIEESYDALKVRFPYIPGFLSFREGPAIVKAIRKLKKKPDLIILDGHGIAHPVNFGIASHIGVITGIPAIGCAKRRLIGEYDEPALKRGSYSLIYYKGGVIGAVLRTRDNVRPVFVSPGHLINIEDSIKIILNSTKNYRIPEPLRRSDILSRRLKRDI